jgi:hypothetical protein
MKKVPSLKFLWIATVWDEAQNGTLTNASSGRATTGKWVVPRVEAPRARQQKGVTKR